MKKFPVEIDLFKSFVHVIIGTEKELEKEAKRIFPMITDVPSEYGAFTFTMKDGDPHAFFPKGFSLDTCVHESVHCANAILDNIGHKYQGRHDEVQPYLVAYIVSQINKLK